VTVGLLKNAPWAATADVSEEMFSALLTMQRVEEIVGRARHSGAKHPRVRNQKSGDSNHRELENS